MFIKLSRFQAILHNFSKIKILIIGDLILDEYVWGEVERISPEAPVPVVWAKKRNYLPGGAANVASNVRSLGADVGLIGVVGKDDRADILLSELKKRKIDTSGIFEVFNRYTSIKTRVIAGHQQVVRVDWETIDSIPQHLENKIKEYFQKNISKYDAVIIEDYGKGLFTSSLVKTIIEEARRKKKIITVDPKEEHFLYYSETTAITPNRKETENAIRNIKLRSNNLLNLTTDKLETDMDIDLAGKELLSFLRLQGLLITLGEKGMRLFEQNQKPYQIDTVAQEVFDVSGAGDTVIATFTLALATGATMKEAAHLANFAAGIVVGKIGVATPTANELMSKIKRFKKMIR